VPNDVSANWHEQDVMVAVADANRQMLLAIAHQIEAEAKPNAEVDTGFMRNSSYVAGAGENTFAAKEQTVTDKRGRKGKRKTAPSAATPSDDNEVIIGFAADYTIYREVIHPFVYPAAQRVAEQAQGIIEPIGKRVFGD